MKLVAGPGSIGDHAGRTLVVPPDHAAYEDDDGRIVVQATTPHPLLRTRWLPVEDDLPEVEIVGVQELSTGMLALVVRAVDFSAELTDEHGEKVAARSLALEQLVEFWKPSEVAQAQQTVADILAKLGRLG